MSICDEGDPPQIFAQTLRKARKIHKCCECHSDIKVGEVYHEVKGKWDGEFYIYRTCDSCEEIRLEVYQKTNILPAFGSVGCCYTEMLREALWEPPE